LLILEKYVGRKRKGKRGVDVYYFYTGTVGTKLRKRISGKKRKGREKGR